ncbi:MAG: ABC transporter substrate-binding protein [Anaerolineae bacterium]|jgi:peptide/nickel transport system substrate-binding protein
MFVGRFMAIWLAAVMLLSACAPAPTSLSEVEATGADPASYIMPGDDWGYPSPFAFYNRGPGYLRMSYLFDTLVWKDETGYIPWLAEDWQVDDDGLVWTFDLRQDVHWHDGRPLTADDVAFTFNYMKEKYERGMVRWNWPLDAVHSAEESEDGRHVTVRMVRPTAGLMMTLFGSLPIIPRHIWEGVDDPMQKLDAEAVIGSSLFTLHEYNKEEGRYIYRPNPDFFLGAPLIDELIFIRVNDEALALMVGDVDEASFSGKQISSVRELGAGGQFKVIQGPSDWTLKLYMHPNHPALNDVGVRQAIAYAIDRQELVERAQMGGAIVASTGILSPHSDWHHPDLPDYAYDPARAQAMLDDAGVTPFQVTLLTSEPYAREAELIKSNLADVGIDVVVRMADRATVDALLLEGDFDLLITGHGGGANPDMGEPSPVWSNEAYLDAYDRSMRAIDDEVRREHVWAMQEILAEELPVLALWHPLMWEVYRPGRVEPFFTPDGVASGIPTAGNKLMFVDRE